MKRIAAPLLVALLAATAALAQAPAAQHDHAMMMKHESMKAMDHDRMFADMMSKHHEDGIRMAQLAVDKAQSAELRSMAQKMIDDQRAEIERMQSLRGEGEKMTMSMDEMKKMMPEMMSEAEMQRGMERLQAASGRDFDAAFTEIMAMHHQGAITMSKHYLEHGTNAGLEEIAQAIIDKQTREREELRAMHDGLSANGGMTSSSSERKRMTKD